MKTRLLFLTFLSALLISSTLHAEPTKRPNIALILADDLGWADTTLYGKTSLYETPNIERLASRGMKFSRAYASPICSPTRASILTGQNAARHGMTAPAAHLPEVRLDAVAKTKGQPNQKACVVQSSTRIDPEIVTLGEVLQDAGYSTGHFGKWHLGMKGFTPLEHGFDSDLPHWHGPGPKTGYLAPWGYENPSFKEGKPGDHIEDRMAKEAVAWLKNRDKTKPFFLNYWQFSVHAPFGAKPELIEQYRKKIKRGDPQQSPTYAAMVHSLDDAVGTLLDALDAEGITDETLIVFYSDNGGNIHCGLEETDAAGEKYITAITSNDPLRGGKGGIHEGGIRVPAVVVWPDVAEAGSTSEVQIQANDLYPTLLKMSGIEHKIEHAIDGVDFTQALRGETMEREPLFTYVPSYGNTPQWLPPSMAVHQGDWKLIRTFHHGEDGAHEYRLYNLKDDIGESNNLAATHPDRVTKMDQLIEDYIAEAEVVEPVANPNFDPAKFDATQIGVQAGGLKMPKEKPTPAEIKPLTELEKKALLGWSARNAEVSIDETALSISGRRPMLVNAKLRAEGETEVRMRIKAPEGGKALLQWRTEDQEIFPAKGQRASFEISGGDWQELSIPLKVKGTLVQLRFYPPASTAIDWIELGSAGKKEESKRWDFGTKTQVKTAK